MKIFIGCSASNNIPKKYIDDCELLIDELMEGNDLVFGACYSGLMAVAHDQAYQHDSMIIGICPELYINDFDNLNCDIEIITKTVGQRTEKLIEEADALVFLPGGIGTVYEFYSAVEAKKCHDFDKPIVLYNSNGFYDDLMVFIDKQIEEKFLRPNDKIPFYITDSIDNVLFYINNYDRITDVPKNIKNNKVRTRTNNEVF